MGACLPSARLWVVVAVLCLCTHVINGERPEHITVRRAKRFNPVVNSPADRKGGNPLNPRPIQDEYLNGACDAAGTPKVDVSHLNDSHQQVMIHWAGKGSQVILCLMRDFVQDIGGQASVFISRDYGSTYENISSKFQIKDGKLAIINTLYHNDNFHSRFVFTDVLNRYIFGTKDFGETIVQWQVPFTPSEVTFHPTDAEVLFVHDTSNPERNLWISEDFGDTWRKIGMFVKSFFASEFSSPPTLYMYVTTKNAANALLVLASQELFRVDTNATTVIEFTVEFEVKDEFLFAVKKSTTTEDTLQLLISYRGGKFLPALFPNDLPHKDYYIADVSEGKVMLCVAHEEYLSNLYVSSVARSPEDPVKFSLSLERIVFFKPSSAWENTWLSEVAGRLFADLHQVKGIRGVFIASQWLTDMTISNSSRPHLMRPEHTVSHISFDHGAQWEPLQPPQKDVDGNLIDCKRTKGCSLHVGQSLSHYYSDTDMTPVVSKGSVPGLILATGTTGPKLKGDTSLYVSVDAGVTWRQVLQGSLRYAVGDHGGILVAVQHYRTAEKTDTLYYSTDDGESWKPFKFSNESLHILGLLTEPGENTTVFTLFGSRPENHKWIFIKVDLRPVFQYVCSPSDYKRWSPSGGPRNHGCLLGRNQVYERRVPHSNCYSGVRYDRPVWTENCPCDRADFECDIGFVIDENSRKCVKDQNDTDDPYTIPSTCTPGHYYNRTKGYRLIQGDTCEGGRDHLYNPTLTACPVPKKGRGEFLLVSTRKEILRLDLQNLDGGVQRLPLPDLKNVITFDFDLENNCIFWADIGYLKIQRYCFDGPREVETLVVEDHGYIEGIAFDWVAKNLYFVDAGRRTLEVIRTDITFGSMRRTLLSNDSLVRPRSIALHPIKGFLFLTDWSESSPKVARAYLDGTNFTTLLGAGLVGFPNGITIDFQEERIFFTDALLKYIGSADFDGRNIKKIISDQDKVAHPFAIGIYKSKIIWDDWREKQVLEADKVSGSGISPIIDFPNMMYDLKVYGHWSQNGINICADTEVCKYLCMAHPNNTYSCLCPDGFQQKTSTDGIHEECGCPDGFPVSDKGLCKPSNGTCPSGFFKCNNNNCIPEKWLCVKDNDCGDGSDESSAKCGCVACYPPNWQCRNGDCIAPEYHCDHHPDCTDSSDEENCLYEPCANNTFQCANGKCIHHQWQCDMEDDCRDGSDEVKCTVNANPECKSTEFMCQDNQCIPASWHCDGDDDCRDQSDETDCHVPSCHPWHFACKTNKHECIFRTGLCDGVEDCDDGSDEANCTTTTTTTTTTTNPPTTNFTLATEREFREDLFQCDDGHYISMYCRCDRVNDCSDNSDEYGCHYFSSSTQQPEIASTCEKNQFQCRTGECIWHELVCDNNYDCPGEEDEEDCPLIGTCAVTEYQCKRSGRCISSIFLCDGYNDCPDSSDEEGCDPNMTPRKSCPDGFLECDEAACLPLVKRCDGTYDCIDLSDEMDCTSDNNKGGLDVF